MLEDEIEKKICNSKKDKKNPKLTWLTCKTYNPSHETMIISQRKINEYETQFSINLTLKAEVEKKIN